MFIHQFSHGSVDFRNKRDAFADYFQNSVLVTRAHKLFRLSLAWPHAFDAEWGGPPAMESIDGSIGRRSRLALYLSYHPIPSDSVGVLENIRSKFSRAWTPYGFVNALNPLTGRYDPYVVGIGTGITLLMVENHRTQLVWNTFMTAPEILKAMNVAGFTQY